MNSAWIIFKKEFRGFYKSPTFYLVAGLMSTVFSWVYPVQLSMFGDLLNNYVMQQGVPKGQLNIHYGVFLRQLSYLNLLMVFVVPALTMKLFSEEKKMKTFDLLLTSPVESLDIVLGKYFAALTAVAGIVFVAFSYPLATATMATISWGPLIIAFIGILFVGAVYASMNLFASSLTENGLVAFVISVILNISIWFVGIGADVVDSEVARKIFEHISLNGHLSNWVEGTIRTTALVFFLSVIGFFCFLTERVVEATRWR